MSLCIIFIILASLCASSSNFCLRKNLDNHGDLDACLVMYCFMSLVIVLMINPAFLVETTVSYRMLSLGMIVGALMGGMLMMTSRALKRGPSSITFAVQNSSCVFPSLILAVIFGTEYGFIMTSGSLIGAVCVITGLLWAAFRQNSSTTVLKSWYIFAGTMLLLQTAVLTLFQWRCLIIQEDLPDHSLIPFNCSLQEELWFMPGLFIAACLLQTIYFSVTQKRFMRIGEMVWGGLGGIVNGASTYFLLNAISIATPLERRFAFPVFAVCVILICNLWGQWLYREPIFWKANFLCMFGILVVSLF